MSGSEELSKLFPLLSDDIEGATGFNFVNIVRWIGWAVLIADVVLIVSVYIFFVEFLKLYEDKMNIFSGLPHLNKCCCCIGLKIGSIIIALIHLFFVIEAFLASGANKHYNQCYNSGTFTKYLGYMSISLAIVLLITIIFFLYNVMLRKNNPGSVLWFMYASLLCLIYNVVLSIALFLNNYTKLNCSPSYILGGTTLISCIVLFYFLVILASYYRELNTTTTV